MRHFGCFSNLEKSRPEAAADFISGMTLEYVGVDVRASFGDYRLNSGQIFLRFFCAFCAHFCAVYNILQPTIVQGVWGQLSSISL